jgi:hypothetical protein
MFELDTAWLLVIVAGATAGILIATGMMEDLFEMVRDRSSRPRRRT